MPVVRHFRETFPPRMRGPFRQAEQEEQMGNLSIDRQDSEEGILNYQVSDEALEIAAAAASRTSPGVVRAAVMAAL